MRFLFASVLAMSIAVSAQAAVQAFLKPDPVVIVVNGTDANRIYDYLDVSPAEKPGSIVEKQLDSPSGQVAFSCRYATLTGQASCTLKVKRDTNLEVSEERKRVYLVSYKSEDTAFLFDRFVKNAEGLVPMYVSEKQDFAFSSNPERFILSYQQVGN